MPLEALGVTPARHPASPIRPHWGGPGLGGIDVRRLRGRPVVFRAHSQRTTLCTQQCAPPQDQACPCQTLHPELGPDSMLHPFPQADSPLLSHILQPSAPSHDIHPSQVCPQAASVSCQAQVSPSSVCGARLQPGPHAPQPHVCTHSPSGHQCRSMRSEQGSHTACVWRSGRSPAAAPRPLSRLLLMNHLVSICLTSSGF